MLFSTAAHAETEPTAMPNWIATTGGSATVVDGAGLQPAATLSLTRVSKKATIGISGTLIRSESGDFQAGVSPDRITIVSLSGTRKFGSLMVDANLTAGWAHFQPGALPSLAGTSIPFTTRTDGFGGGAGVSLNIDLGGNAKLQPRVSAGYSVARIARKFEGPVAGPTKLTNQTDDVTFSASTTLVKPFGRKRQHMISASIAINDSASFVHRPGRTDVVRNTSEMTDTFIDYGIVGSFSLRKRLSLDVSATRSAWVDGPESTVFALDFRIMY